MQLLHGKAQEDDIRRGMFTHKKNNIAFKTPLLSSRTPRLCRSDKSVGPWLFLLVYNHINFPVGLQRIKTHFTFFLPHCSQFSTTQPAHSTSTYATLQHCNFHFCCCFLRTPLRLLILLVLPHTSALLQLLILLAQLLVLKPMGEHKHIIFYPFMHVLTDLHK